MEEGIQGARVLSAQGRSFSIETGSNVTLSLSGAHETIIREFCGRNAD